MIKIEDIIFILNPNSGKKKINGIINQLKQYNNKIAYFISKTYLDFEEFAKENIEQYKVFIIVGGDGTINSSVNFFYNYPDKLLAIFPIGSGNGFANEMGFNKNINSLIEDVLSGETIEIDVLKANNEKFINLFGLGFDSYVAHDFSSRKKRGLKTYVLSVIRSIFNFRPIIAEIKSKNFNLKGKYNMVIVANTAQFGNQARIAPSAKPNNNSYVLTLVKPFPFYYYPVFVIKLMTGKLKKSKYIDYKNISDDLIIKTKFNKHHIDGEPGTNVGIINVSILDYKVKFIKTKTCKL